MSWPRLRTVDCEFEGLPDPPNSGALLVDVKLKKRLAGKEYAQFIALDRAKVAILNSAHCDFARDHSAPVPFHKHENQHRQLVTMPHT